MSTPESAQLTKFYQGISLILTGILAALATYLSGKAPSGAATISMDPYPTLHFDSGLSSEGGWTRVMRQIMLDVQRYVFPTVEDRLSGPGTKVPKDTGYLRESIIVRFSEDGSEILVEWPVEYARYLWEDYAPGYISAAGLMHHGEVTYPDWSEWAVGVVGPMLVEGVASVARMYGIQADVTY